MLSNTKLFQLSFEPFTRTSRGYAFPCDRDGHVDLDSLDERTRINYFYARAMVGRELSPPIVEASPPALSAIEQYRETCKAQAVRRELTSQARLTLGIGGPSLVAR